MPLGMLRALLATPITVNSDSPWMTSHWCYLPGCRTHLSLYLLIYIFLLSPTYLLYYLRRDWVTQQQHMSYALSTLDMHMESRGENRSSCSTVHWPGEIASSWGPFFKKEVDQLDCIQSRLTRTREIGRVFKFYSSKGPLIVLGLVSLEKRRFKYLIAGLSMWRGFESWDCLKMTSSFTLHFEKDSSRKSWNRDTERIPFWKASHAHKTAPRPIVLIPMGLSWLFLFLFFFPPLFRSPIPSELTRCQQILWSKSFPSGMMEHEIPGKLEKHKSARGLTGSAAKSIHNWGLASCTIWLL